VLTKTTALPVDSETSDTTLSCPPGTQLSGGGVKPDIFAAARPVVSSYPVDDGFDVDSRPDDAWAGTLLNGLVDAGMLDVFAICTQSDEEYQYIRTQNVVNANQQEGAIADCPEGTEVTGGGVETIGASKLTEVGPLFPIDADGDAVPDDGWQGFANAGFGGANMYVTAICSPLGLGPSPSPTVSASPSASASPSPSPTDHVRSISLRLRGHLRALGLVDSDLDACLDTVVVKIQKKRASSWKTVGSGNTEVDGSFKVVSLKDKPGRYRAKVKEIPILGEICPKAKSKVVRHKHRQK
jgi:hypothetical protein